MITGFPSSGGIDNLSSDGARCPISGGEARGIEGGDGANQELSSCLKVIVFCGIAAMGLENRVGRLREAEARRRFVGREVHDMI